MRIDKILQKKKHLRAGERKERNQTQSTQTKLPSQYLKTLKPKEKTALLLWTQEGYQSKEIGEIMKCSPSTVRVYLYKARKKIKTILENKNDSLRNN